MLYNDIDSETAIAESNESMENYIYFYVWEQSRLKVFAKDIDNKVSERLMLEMNTVKRDAVSLCIFEPDGMIKKYEISFFSDNMVKVNDDKFYMYEDSYNALKTELVDNKSISDAISFLGNGFYFPYYAELFALSYFDNHKYRIKNAELHIQFIQSNYIYAANAAYEYLDGELVRFQILELDGTEIYTKNNSCLDKYTISYIHSSKRESHHDKVYVIRHQDNDLVANITGEINISYNTTYFSGILVRGTKHDLKSEEDAIDFIERIGKGGDSTAAYRNKTILNTLKTEGIYGYNDGGNSTSYKNNAKSSMEAAINALTNGKDYSHGAIRWDGFDLAAKGFNHVKAVNCGIRISETFFNSFKSAWSDDLANRYSGGKYAKFSDNFKAGDHKATADTKVVFVIKLVR